MPKRFAVGDVRYYGVLFWHGPTKPEAVAVEVKIRRAPKGSDYVQVVRSDGMWGSHGRRLSHEAFGALAGTCTEAFRRLALECRQRAKALAAEAEIVNAVARGIEGNTGRRKAS